MAIALDQVRIVGRLALYDDTPLSGSIIFSSTPVLADSQNNSILFPMIFTAQLGTAPAWGGPAVPGEFGISLPATDDPDIVPEGWTWHVKENVTNGREYNVNIPLNSPLMNGYPTIKFATIAPATSVGVGGIAYATQQSLNATNTNISNLGVRVTTIEGTSVGSKHIIQDATTAYATQPNLKFIGSATVTNDGPNTATVVNISGGTPADGSVTAAKLASNAVTTIKILDSNITNAKLAAVGAVANTYTNSTIAIDAAGRVVAASSSSGSAGTPTLANIPAGSVISVIKNVNWPARPTSRADVTVIWIGADPSPAIISVPGTGGMLNGSDLRITI